jgi:hypothetical protein
VAAQSKARVYSLSFAGIGVRIPQGGMEATCECCVLSGRSLCDESITRPEEVYPVWRV